MQSSVLSSAPSAFSSSSPFRTTNPPTVCEDVMDLSEEDFNLLAIGPVNTSVPSSGGTGTGGLSLNFENVDGKIIITVPFPAGATLELLDISGTHDYYYVEVEDENGISKLVENIRGESALDRNRNFFNEEIPAGGALIITIQGPNTTFSANVTEFRVCIEDLDFCRITPDNVYRELHFLPLDGILGVMAPDNTTIIKYGDDIPTIESGVIVFGSCYECTCEGFVLRCRIKSDCEICPNHTLECVGNCTDARVVVTYDEPGVPVNCQVDEVPCTPDGCTTPNECPMPWSEWSSCDQKCQRHRQRSCEGCYLNCEDDHNLSETEICEVCITTVTPYSTTETPCTDTEIYDCVSPYEECMEECTVYRMGSVCNNLDNSTDSCTDKCRCKDGYRRNMFGQCVQEYACECYNTTVPTPIPMNYLVNVSECEYCECLYTGYECKERDDCCEWKEWSEWSGCSVTCGPGIRVRTRGSSGHSCDPDGNYEEQSCEYGECPCILDDGTILISGEIFADECQECTCKNSEYICMNRPDEIPPWNDDNCDKKCYCAENGTKICVDDPELGICKEIRENCNNETHVLKEDPTSKCCPKCIPIQKPCTKELVEYTRLNFTGDGGYCVSEMFPLHKCVGTCGPSSQEPVLSEYNASLGKFELVLNRHCHCCGAITAPKEIPFTCDGNLVDIEVEVVAGCECSSCG